MVQASPTTASAQQRTASASPPASLRQSVDASNPRSSSRPLVVASRPPQPWARTFGRQPDARPGCPLRGPCRTAREAKICDLRPQKLQKSPRLAALAGKFGQKGSFLLNFDAFLS